MSQFGKDLIQALSEAIAHAKGEGDALISQPIDPRDVRKRGDGLRVFPDSARDMAGSARARRNGAGSDPGAARGGFR